MKPVIAISLGDVNGVGPEVILKAFVRSDLFTQCRPVVFGPAECIEWRESHLGTGIDIPRITSLEEAREGSISLFDTGGVFDPSQIGRATAEAGAHAIRAIEAAYAAVRDGGAEALVTAPVSKEAIALAGSPFKGHTDMLAAMAGAANRVIMILRSNTLTVGLVTIHVPLREVAPLVTHERVLRTIEAGRSALETDFGVQRPRLAVLALNPHAGDGGAIGSEEIEAIVPAIAEARAAGIAVEGPFPADGFFSAHNRDLFDMVVAMYHDQGLIPFKLQARGRGVNVSSGLPIVRTSPDHGTAYNIAGQGIASADSMKEAILAARTIAVNRGLAAAGGSR